MGLIVRAIVYRYDFEILKSLSIKGVDRLVERFLSVVTGEQNRNAWNSRHVCSYSNS